MNYRVKIKDSETDCELLELGSFASELEAETAAEAYFKTLSIEEKFYTEYEIYEKN